MILKSIKYCRNKDEENEWRISNPTGKEWLDLNQINLVVGRNASGKTKTIDIIRVIADLLAGNIKLSELVRNTSEYELIFEDANEKIEYFLDFKEGKVIQEILKINDEQKLNRKDNKLFYEGFKQYAKFNTDDDSLTDDDSIVVPLMQQNTVQHPFFKKLYYWGKNLSHYRFGSSLGKNVFLRDINKVKEDDKVDLKDGNGVTKIFIKGEKRFRDKFIAEIKNNMKKLDYSISKVDVNILKYLPIGFGLHVKEVELNTETDQMEMSQGMFRALSLLIQLNYSLLAQIPSCILIDDIGEGLDYERSKALIDLIIEKVKGSSVQVIMTTNDQFVMDKVPLEYWQVIKRESGKAVFYNYKNAKKTFDDFAFTGLNNFDFYTSEFFVHGFDDYVKDVTS